jgi:chromosome partitioning protein
VAQVQDSRKAAYAIVVGHEADGCGSTTLCLHIAMALLARNQRVMLIDLDGRRKGLTNAIANRLGFAGRTGLRPIIPAYAYLGGAPHRMAETLARAFSSVEKEHDFIIVDASGIDPELARLVYSLADTLILPFTLYELDIAVDVAADAEIFACGGFRSLGATIHEARSERRRLEGRTMDVVVLRNRVSDAGARVSGRFEERLDRAAIEYGFRTVEGLCERDAYRRWMDQGLTVFDQGEEIVGSACLAEAQAMVDDLKLPLDETARKRAAVRAQWTAAAALPLGMDEILVS